MSASFWVCWFGEEKYSKWQMFCPLCVPDLYFQSQVVCEVRWRVFGVLARRVSGCIVVCLAYQQDVFMILHSPTTLPRAQKENFRFTILASFRSVSLQLALYLNSQLMSTQSGRNITAFGRFCTTVQAGTFGAQLHWYIWYIAALVQLLQSGSGTFGAQRSSSGTFGTQQHWYIWNIAAFVQLIQSGSGTVVTQQHWYICYRVVLVHLVHSCSGTFGTQQHWYSCYRVVLVHLVPHWVGRGVGTFL